MIGLLQPPSSCRTMRRTTWTCLGVFLLATAHSVSAGKREPVVDRRLAAISAQVDDRDRARWESAKEASSEEKRARQDLASSLKIRLRRKGANDEHTPTVDRYSKNRRQGREHASFKDSGSEDESEAYVLPSTKKARKKRKTFGRVHSSLLPEDPDPSWSSETTSSRSLASFYRTKRSKEAKRKSYHRPPTEPLPNHGWYDPVLLDHYTIKELRKLYTMRFEERTRTCEPDSTYLVKTTNGYLMPDPKGRTNGEVLALDRERKRDYRRRKNESLNPGPKSDTTRKLTEYKERLNRILMSDPKEPYMVIPCGQGAKEMKPSKFGWTNQEWVMRQCKQNKIPKHIYSEYLKRHGLGGSKLGAPTRKKSTPRQNHESNAAPSSSASAVYSAPLSTGSQSQQQQELVSSCTDGTASKDSPCFQTLSPGASPHDGARDLEDEENKVYDAVRWRHILGDPSYRAPASAEYEDSDVTASSGTTNMDHEWPSSDEDSHADLIWRLKGRKGPRPTSPPPFHAYLPVPTFPTYM